MLYSRRELTATTIDAPLSLEDDTGLISRIIRRQHCRAAFAGVIATVSLLSDQPASAQEPAAESVILPVELSDEAAERALLEEQLRRFADRYFTRMSLAADTILVATDDPELEALMRNWRLNSLATIIDLAVGRSETANLLDMMVLTRFSRLVVENYWVPEELGETLGRSLIDASRALEADIWSIGREYLTAEQASDLEMLIDDWHDENPDQIYPWYVRSDAFSGQRAAEIEAMRNTNGLFGIRGAVDNIEEFRDLAERVMFYIQRVPYLAMFGMDSGTASLLQNPSADRLLDDTDQLTQAFDELVDVIAKMPDERFVALDQMAELLGTEREAVFAELGEAAPYAEAVMRDLAAAMQSFERVLSEIRARNEAAGPDRQRFDIDRYREFASEAGNAAAQIQSLTDSIEALVASPGWNERQLQFGALREGVAELGDRLVVELFIAGAGLIILFFFLLVVYRYITLRVLRRAPE